MRRWVRLAPAALAAMLAGPAAAAGAEAAARWYLQVDNDVVFFTDRWYTSGVRLARVAPRGGWELELGLVQEIFTPEAGAFHEGNTDRGPAARLMLSAARHDDRDGIFRTLQLDLGVRGPAALGEQATSAIHRVIAAHEVDWSRQGPNRFDAQAVAARSHRGSPLAFHYGAVVGTQAGFAHAGLELRDRAAAPFSPALRFAATPPPENGGTRGWSGFLGASVRGVWRNELLRPGYDPAVPDPSRRPVVGRMAAGVTWIGACCTATFAVAQDTREFDTQRIAHKFGSLTVHMDF